jgi:pimeloyl-ACP methyl ester carboxylesterase
MAERRRRWPWVILAVVSAVILAAWLLLLSPLPVMPEAAAAAESGRVEGEALVFGPAGPAPVGVILYTGARIRPEAYAPQGLAIGGHGIPVFIPYLTLNLAILDQQASAEIIGAHPDVERWVVVGHSLGGAMAARLVDRGVVEGLVLWAAYPEGSLDLAGSGAEVASVYGTNDAIATPVEVLAAAPRLPETTRFVSVEGGNHAQFGWYGDQRGDGVATVSRQVQQAEAVTAVLDVVARLTGGG